MHQLCRVFVFVCLAGSLSACATLSTRHAITDPALAERAVVAGHPGFRFWGDRVPDNFSAAVKERLPNLPKMAQGATRIKGRPVVEILALSGGGGDGAFGAGLLAGWTKQGNRPEFEVVTGISAGAIIAPFAFLGPKYDPQLQEIWTKYQTNQLVTASILPGLLGGSALGDTSPMAALFARYVDKALLQRIAAEYKRGRILLIGTTNLDAQRPVIWNMGEIASSQHPQALELFRKVILASSAIPGAFPPVNIKVNVDGKQYDELHVDGGTTLEVFVSPINTPFKTFDQLYDKKPIRRIYIVKNGKITPEPEAVKEKTLSIAARAIATLIKSQSGAEIYRIYRMAKDNRAEFNFAAVPQEFSYKPKQMFDPVYQQALFDEGVRLGSSGKHWMKKPPTNNTKPRVQ